MWPPNKVRILVYHSLCSTNQDRGKDEWKEWDVSSKAFETQMRLLSKKAYNVLSVDETLNILKTGKRFPPRAVCITFDDGYRNNYTYAFPILLRHGLRATFYLVTGYIGAHRLFAWIKTHDAINAVNAQNPSPNQPLDWDEVSEMMSHGMEFASHSHTHPNFSDIDLSTVEWEIIESRRQLAINLSSYSNTFACPFGVHGPGVERLKSYLKATDFRGAFLGKYGAAGPKTDCFDLPRISIYGGDSINVFKHKIDGAYDWISSFYYYWQRIWILVYRFAN